MLLGPGQKKAYLGIKSSQHMSKDTTFLNVLLMQCRVYPIDSVSLLRFHPLECIERLSNVE